MELLFRFAAIFALLARIGATYYCRHRALNVATASATRNGAQRGAESGHFTNANVLLFSNIWVTIAMTFWVTALIAFPDHSFS